MPVMRLGRREVASLPVPDRAVIYFDSTLKGFGLRLRPAVQSRAMRGTWVIEYRPGGGGRGVAKRRLAIGSYPTLTPDEARDAAKTMLARIQLGDDPAAVRHQARRAGTVSDLLQTYMTEVIRSKRKPHTAAVFGGYIENHVKPAIGNRKASSLVRGDLARLHHEIGSNHPTTANRVLTMLAAAFSYGLKAGLLPEGFKNPAVEVDRFRESSRERYLSIQELARLGNALRTAESMGLYWEPDENRQIKHAPKPESRRLSIDQYDIAAIRLLLFTGCRLREILDLRWNEVDFQRGMLRLPDSKTGRRVVMLGGAALALLTDLDRVGPFVIPSAIDWERPRGSIRRPWLAIAKAANLEGVRIHDLRHSYAATGAGAGLGLQLVGRLLGHSNPSTTQRYAHLADDPLRRAADQISDAIDQALG